MREPTSITRKKVFAALKVPRRFPLVLLAKVGSRQGKTVDKWVYSSMQWRRGVERVTVLELNFCFHWEMALRV
jgi:hypothetical protein